MGRFGIAFPGFVRQGERPDWMSLKLHFQVSRDRFNACLLTNCMIIRKANKADLTELLTLYKEVASISQGIARFEHEISLGYIESVYNQATKHGLMLVSVDQDKGQIVAEIHASKYGLEIFNHILTNLTVVVKPSLQGQGVGKQLFQAFLHEVDTTLAEVGRIELESRSTNQRSIGLYKSLGFVQEGAMRFKTCNADGSYENSLLFARLKPGFYI